MRRSVARLLVTSAGSKPFFLASTLAGDSGGPGGDSKYRDYYFSKLLNTSSLQSAFGTGTAVPIILITTVLHDNIAKTSRDRPYQN